MIPRTFLALALVTTGCAANAVEQAPPRTEREVIAVDAPPPEPEAVVPRGRPRLSQTVTLGQGDYAPMPEPASAQAQGVVVNNNVTIVNQPPAYDGYGFFGGYAYGAYGGGYGGGYDRGYRGSHTPGSMSNGVVRPGYTSPPGGWAGAQGTALPGHTPGVAGNWSAPPSHGPRTMK